MATKKKKRSNKTFTMRALNPAPQPEPPLTDRDVKQLKARLLKR